MNHPELTFSETRAIIRRHAHDLRNLLNCMDLEIVCFQEDNPSEAAGPFLAKIREQIALTERTVHSLSVRFREPSVHMAAATDIFYSWRQHMRKLGRADQFQWEEPDCATAINVDFTAVITVLADVCLQTKSGVGAAAPAASLRTDGASVIYSVEESPGDIDYPPDAQQWREWERLALLSGGTVERSASPRTVRLIFPAA